MKTLIFNSYNEFLKRPDKLINGVSQDFANENPKYEAMNETNKACWNCSDCSSCSDCFDCSDCSDCSSCSSCSSCSDCSYCSDCSSCSDCSYCSDCSDCSSCSSCSDCSYCSYCSSCSSCSSCSYCSYCYYCYYCSDCSSCFDCSDCSKIKRVEGTKGDKKVFAFPFVENIHQRVYEAIIENPKSFNMGSWHGQNSCGTTHCRAGWVIELAGEQGYALQKQTSPTFAALQIYKASCPELPVSPYRFHESNELALANIKEYAEKEKQLKGL
jgi:hypothetical protein